MLKQNENINAQYFNTKIKLIYILSFISIIDFLKKTEFIFTSTLLWMNKTDNIWKKIHFNHTFRGKIIQKKLRFQWFDFVFCLLDN